MHSCFFWPFGGCGGYTASLLMKMLSLFPLLPSQRAPHLSLCISISRSIVPSPGSFRDPLVTTLEQTFWQCPRSTTAWDCEEVTVPLCCWHTGSGELFHCLTNGYRSRQCRRRRIAEVALLGTRSSISSGRAFHPRGEEFIGTLSSLKLDSERSQIWQNRGKNVADPSSEDNIMALMIRQRWVGVILPVKCLGGRKFLTV